MFWAKRKASEKTGIEIIIIINKHLDINLKLIIREQSWCHVIYLVKQTWQYVNWLMKVLHRSICFFHISLLVFEPRLTNRLMTDICAIESQQKLNRFSQFDRVSSFVYSLRWNFVHILILCDHFHFIFAKPREKRDIL